MELLRYIGILEECLGRKAEKNLLPLQPGDVPNTYADVDALMQDVGYKPATPIEQGIASKQYGFFFFFFFFFVFLKKKDRVLLRSVYCCFSETLI